jgi:SAM-dependent methyltransferase
MTVLDAAAYKATTRQHWQDAAEAWHRWAPTINAWLTGATDSMLSLAQVRRGDCVLDVAAGAGEPALTAARRVGPSGRVVATDFASKLLAFAEAEARAHALAEIVDTFVMDAEHLQFADASFDAVLCRLGLMYFPNRARALAEMLRVLRPHGRLAVVVFSTPERNPFVSIPMSIICGRVQPAMPAYGRVGPFSVGAPGALERALVDAGFADVEIREVAAPLRLASAADCLRFQRESFGALQALLAGVAATEQEAIWAEVGQALRQFEGPAGFEGPCEVLIGAGTG